MSEPQSETPRTDAVMATWRIDEATIKRLMDHARTLERELATLRATREQDHGAAIEALRKYGIHKEECQLNDFDNCRRKCTCGLDEALATVTNSQQKGGEQTPQESDELMARVDAAWQRIGATLFIDKSAPTSHPEGAATDHAFTPAAGFALLCEVCRNAATHPIHSVATPPSITDAAKEILDRRSIITRAEVESILSRLLGAQAGEVKRLKEALADSESFATEETERVKAYDVANAQLRKDAKRLKADVARLMKVIQTKLDHPNWDFKITCGAEAAIQPSEELTP